MKLTKKYFKLSNNIFELGLKPNEFVVLAYIARCSNNNSQAFPSYNKIAEKCNIGLSTAKRIVTDLVNRELLTKETRLINDNKSNNSNAYSLTKKFFGEVEEVVIEDKKETDDDQLIRDYFEGKIKVDELIDEDSDLQDKVETVETVVGEKITKTFKNLLKKLSWDEIIELDEQLSCKNVNASYYLEAIYRLRPDLKANYRN